MRTTWWADMVWCVQRYGVSRGIVTSPLEVLSNFTVHHSQMHIPGAIGWKGSITLLFYLGALQSPRGLCSSKESCISNLAEQ